MTREPLSLAEARRIALSAQGFGPRRAGGVTNAGDLRDMLGRLGAIQIDSVNVLVRSHYLPLYARLGAYSTELLDELTYGGRRRSFFEYWAHQASLVPVDAYPFFRWRMDRAREGLGMWKHVADLARDQPRLIAQVERELRERGPLGAGELSVGAPSRGGWWGWSDAKRALELLFWTGRVTTATRRSFERVYDLVEQALPERVLRAKVLDVASQQRALVAWASRALGVATERDLRDYFRLPARDAKARIAELVEERALQPVRVEGWSEAAFLHPGVRLPARVEAAALLSPFDSLVWDRSRTERLFGFRLRLELYTPAHRRVHGYYVLPFLLGERLVARVDLKRDRERGALLVRSLHLEPGSRRAEVLPALRDELASMARWLELERVEAEAQGRAAGLVSGSASG